MIRTVVLGNTETNEASSSVWEWPHQEDSLIVNSLSFLYLNDKIMVHLSVLKLLSPGKADGDNNTGVKSLSSCPGSSLLVV